MENETIVLDVKEYKRLLEDSNFLGCLQATGVDNWEGYDEAVRMFREEND